MELFLNLVRRFRRYLKFNSKEKNGFGFWGFLLKTLEWHHKEDYYYYYYYYHYYYLYIFQVFRE